MYFDVFFNGNLAFSSTESFLANCAGVRHFGPYSTAVRTLLHLFASVLGVWYRCLSSGLRTELHFAVFKRFDCNVLGFFSALSTLLELDCRFPALCHMPWKHWCRFLQIWQMAWSNECLNVTRCSWLHCWLKRDILFELHKDDKVSWKLKIIRVFIGTEC